MRASFSAHLSITTHLNLGYIIALHICIILNIDAGVKEKSMATCRGFIVAQGCML